MSSFTLKTILPERSSCCNNSACNRDCIFFPRRIASSVPKLYKYFKRCGNAIVNDKNVFFRSFFDRVGKQIFSDFLKGSSAGKSLNEATLPKQKPLKKVQFAKLAKKRKWEKEVMSY